jgi:hypothetical protein
MEEVATKSHRLSKRRIITFVLIAICIIASAITVTIIRDRQHTNSTPFSIETRQAVDFPLYYPTNLPAGFTLDKTSISSTDEVVLYNLKAPGDAIINVSVQKRPEGANLEAFYAQELSDVHSIPTTHGVVKIGKRGQSIFASLVTDTSWIIGTAKDGTLQEPVREVFTSLQIVR